MCSLRALGQPSNRDALLEGALACFEDKGFGEITARDIAAKSNANLASIGYHFGSKDALLVEAVNEGFRRWLTEIGRATTAAIEESGRNRFEAAVEAAKATANANRPLALAFLEALARAPRDPGLAEALAAGYRDSRAAVASLLGLEGEHAPSLAAATLMIAAFDGLLIQGLIEPGLVPDDLAPAIVQLAALATEAELAHR